MERDKAALLREIPSVDFLLQDLKVRDPALPHFVLRKEIRKHLQDLRERILTDGYLPEGHLSYESIRYFLTQKLTQIAKPGLCRALNATGVILHTGLGRAPLPPQALANISRELRGYVVLEIARETGERQNRDHVVKELLCDLTGAEDATVVNNNAAAVLLTLAALAAGREVIVSRGQLVEIGGSFRIPEVMNQSGATLVEVGCTNKVAVSDYESAISPKTGALLWVHTSNFKIMGFMHEVSLEDLSCLARQAGLPLIQDAGSGALLDLFPWGLKDEPLISAGIGKGADIVCFSGDKLLGACQAGVIVGKKVLVEKIRKHPLARAVRVDKVTLSILETTLRHYCDPETLRESVPALQMLTMKADKVRERAQKIARGLKEKIPHCRIEVVSTVCRAGSGAFPVQDIPSYAVAIHSDAVETGKLAKHLRLGNPPVFARIENDILLLEPRTLLADEDEEIVEIVVKAWTSTTGPCSIKCDVPFGNTVS